MSNGSIVRKNLNDLSKPIELRELNRQLDWMWKKILGGLTAKDFSDSGMKNIVTTVEKTIAEEILVDEIETNTLTGALAKLMVAIVGVCDADYLTAVDADIESLIVRKGLGGSFTLENLKVIYAQIVNATIGDLCIKASDGNYYLLDVSQDGTITATKTTVTSEEVSTGHTDAGNVILGTDITAEELNAKDIYASFALMEKIDASRINVSTLVAREAFATSLFAQEAFLNLLRTTKIVGDKSITLIAEDASKAVEDAAAARIGSIHDGETPPEEADVGQLWLDRSIVPCVLRRRSNAELPIDDIDGWEIVNDSAIIRAVQDEMLERQMNLEAQQKQFATFLRLDKEMVRIGKNGVTSEFQIDAWGAGVAINGIIFSRFESDRVRLGNMEIRKPVVGGLAFDSITDVAGGANV